MDTVLKRLGVTEDSWRVDVSPHPFTSWLSAQDTRVTTRFNPEAEFESVLAAMHEFGHALYERQIPPELQRTNVGRGPSMSAHESQSKLWENHVGRNAAFAPVLAAELRAGGFDIAPEALHAAITAVEPSLIRVSADPLTYPLHIVLRFDLEVALMDGSLDVADLPAAWNDGMRRLLGVEVPDDAHGVLQDMHWSAGAFGYFPSYALGCLIAAQLWEALEAGAGAQDDALAPATSARSAPGWPSTSTGTAAGSTPSRSSRPRPAADRSRALSALRRAVHPGLKRRPPGRWTRGVQAG